MIQENPLSGALKSWTYEQFALTEPRSHGEAGTVLLTDETPNRCVRRVLAMNLTTLLTYHLARVVKALTLGRQKQLQGSLFLAVFCQAIRRRCLRLQCLLLLCVNAQQRNNPLRLTSFQEE